MNPLQFGIPNSRLRYYLLAKLSPLKFVGLDSTKSDHLLDHIPPHDDDPHESSQTSHAASPDLRQYVDLTMDEETFVQFRIPDRVLNKWGRLFDIVLPSGTRTCCFTRGERTPISCKLAIHKDIRVHAACGTCWFDSPDEREPGCASFSVLTDWFRRFVHQTTQVFDWFLGARASGDENAVRILDPLCLRYFTPTELLRIFHFTDANSPSVNFIWPPDVSTKSKYRLIGNSVNVEVS